MFTFRACSWNRNTKWTFAEVKCGDSSMQPSSPQSVFLMSLSRNESPSAGLCRPDAWAMGGPDPVWSGSLKRRISDRIMRSEDFWQRCWRRSTLHYVPQCEEHAEWSCSLDDCREEAKAGWEPLPAALELDASFCSWMMNGFVSSLHCSPPFAAMTTWSAKEGGAEGTKAAYIQIYMYIKTCRYVYADEGSHSGLKIKDDLTGPCLFHRRESAAGFFFIPMLDIIFPLCLSAVKTTNRPVFSSRSVSAPCACACRRWVVVACLSKAH